MADFSIGVDLGGTNLRIAAVDEAGNLIEKIALVTQVLRGRDYVINEMCEAILALISRLPGSGKLLGIGVGVPGMIDLRTGFIRECPNLPGWSEVSVRAEIERRLGMKVILENDANAAAIGEMWLGTARGILDLAILTLGTGVGGGVVINGKIFHGVTGMAGEFGHITIDPEGLPCTCGARGCLEQYASATAIVRMANGAHDSALSGRAGPNQTFSAKCIYDLAIQGNEPARRIFECVGRSLGIAIANLVNALNLPIYVIGGGVTGAWDAFAPSLFDELRQRSTVYAATEGLTAIERATTRNGNTLITRALLGSDAGLYGAARLPMLASL